MKNKYIKEDIKENITMFTRYPLKLVSILIVKYLQKKYKKLSIDSKYKQSSIRLANLKLFQYLLYYFKIQFSAWGYFHPSCIWTEKDEKFFIKLFPELALQAKDMVRSEEDAEIAKAQASKTQEWLYE